MLKGMKTRFTVHNSGDDISVIMYFCEFLVLTCYYSVYVDLNTISLTCTQAASFIAAFLKPGWLLSYSSRRDRRDLTASIKILSSIILLIQLK